MVLAEKFVGAVLERRGDLVVGNGPGGKALGEHRSHDLIDCRLERNGPPVLADRFVTLLVYQAGVLAFREGGILWCLAT